MAGNVDETPNHPCSSSDQPLDFILAACDVEGNFLVVKAYQYTDLLSCMLLNSWVFHSRLGFPLLTGFKQMGDPSLPVLLVVTHAHKVRLDSTCCTRSSLHPCHLFFTTIINTLGHSDLCWWPWDARRIRSTH